MNDQHFSDGEFVYINPDTKEVVGRVEWDKNGNPLSKEREESVQAVPEEGEKRIRKRKKRHYPWGSYNTMNRIFKLKGVVKKEKEPETYISLDEAMQKSNEEPFWE